MLRFCYLYKAQTILLPAGIFQFRKYVGDCMRFIPLCLVISYIPTIFRVDMLNLHVVTFHVTVFTVSVYSCTSTVVTAFLFTVVAIGT